MTKSYLYFIFNKRPPIIEINHSKDCKRESHIIEKSMLNEIIKRGFNIFLKKA